MSSGIAEKTVEAQTGVAGVEDDLGEEITSTVQNLAFHKTDFLPSTLQAHLPRKEKQQRVVTKTMTENVSLFRTIWRVGRARDSGAFQLIPALRHQYLDLLISLQKSLDWSITLQERLEICRTISVVSICYSASGEIESRNSKL